MPTREELKAIIDQLPESKLEQLGVMLKHFGNPPPPPSPEIERLRERGPNYRTLVKQRFRETRRPGTISGMGGGGSAGMQDGVPFARQSFGYWDDKALIYQSLQSFDGQEIELIERLSFSADRTTLICALEISGGGHTVKHQDELPTSQAEHP